MLASWLLYVAETSFCLAAFALLYRVLLARLTYFSWNRWYLLGAVLASLVLPLFGSAPLAALLLAKPAVSTSPGFALLQWDASGGAVAAARTTAPPDKWPWIIGVISLLYGLGMLYRLQGLVRNVRGLRQLIRQHPRSKRGPSWIVEVSDPQAPAFSFGNFIFLSPQHANLCAAEREQVIAHELVHVRQRHTLDLLLLECVGVLLWFNPVVPYLREQLKQVHEFLADAAVVHTSSVVDYGQLLVKLAAQPTPFSLIHTFSTTQLLLRVAMLTTPASSPSQKLRFLVTLPVLAGAWLITSCIGSPVSETPPASGRARSAASSTPIGRIEWKGNSVVGTDRLNQVFGLSTGAAYDSLVVAERLGSITALYMDQGYLFFSIEHATRRQPSGSVDLDFRISEGRKANVGNITFVGNGPISPQALLEAIPLRSGDVFNRSELLEAQKSLALLGPFDPTQIRINPQPAPRPTAATDLVDIQFTLAAKK